MSARFSSLSSLPDFLHSATSGPRPFPAGMPPLPIRVARAKDACTFAQVDRRRSASEILPDCRAIPISSVDPRNRAGPPSAQSERIDSRIDSFLCIGLGVPMSDPFQG
jgi:hypothetical protein